MTLSQISSEPPNNHHNTEPLVSIILPTYGDFGHISSAIESIFEQTFSNYELIIVDSTGVSQLKSFCESHSALTYTHQKPQGPSAARNYGIDTASGELIGFIDADDRWRHDKLEYQVEKLQNGAEVVYSDTYLVDGNNKRYFTSLSVEDPKRHHIKFLYEGGVPMLTVMAHRQCFDRWKFDDSLHLAEDRNLLVKLFRDFHPERIPEPLAYYKRRNDSLSSDIDQMHHCELESIKKLCNCFPEVETHRRSLVANAHYKYGKKLLRSQRKSEARQQLVKAMKLGSRDARTIILTATSLLPIGGSAVLSSLETLQEKIP